MSQTRCEVCGRFTERTENTPGDYNACPDCAERIWERWQRAVDDGRAPDTYERELPDAP